MAAAACLALTSLTQRHECMVPMQPTLTASERIWQLRYLSPEFVQALPERAQRLAHIVYYDEWTQLNGEFSWQDEPDNLPYPPQDWITDWTVSMSDDGLSCRWQSPDPSFDECPYRHTPFQLTFAQPLCPQEHQQLFIEPVTFPRRTILSDDFTLPPPRLERSDWHIEWYYRDESGQRIKTRVPVRRSIKHSLNRVKLYGSILYSDYGRVEGPIVDKLEAEYAAHRAAVLASVLEEAASNHDSAKASPASQAISAALAAPTHTSSATPSTKTPDDYTQPTNYPSKLTQASPPRRMVVANWFGAAIVLVLLAVARVPGVALTRITYAIAKPRAAKKYTRQRQLSTHSPITVGFLTSEETPSPVATPSTESQDADEKLQLLEEREARLAQQEKKFAELETSLHELEQYLQSDQQSVIRDRKRLTDEQQALASMKSRVTNMEGEAVAHLEHCKGMRFELERQLAEVNERQHGLEREEKVIQTRVQLCEDRNRQLKHRELELTAREQDVVRRESLLAEKEAAQCAKAKEERKALDAFVHAEEERLQQHEAALRQTESDLQMREAAIVRQKIDLEKATRDLKDKEHSVRALLEANEIHVNSLESDIRVKEEKLDCRQEELDELNRSLADKAKCLESQTATLELRTEELNRREETIRTAERALEVQQKELVLKLKELDLVKRECQLRQQEEAVQKCGRRQFAWAPPDGVEQPSRFSALSAPKRNSVGKSKGPPVPPMVIVPPPPPPPPVDLPPGFTHQPWG